jgi:hypothetical protein
VLADTFAIGTRNLPGTAALDKRTVTLSEAVANYGTNPAVLQSLDRLTLTLTKLGPPLAFLTPGQATCNYVTLFLRNVSSVLSEHVNQGTFLRLIPVTIDDLPGRESEPASQLYTGPSGASSGPVHVNPYPNTDAPGQSAECAAGNEPFIGGKAVIGNPPGNLGLKTESTKASGK